MKPSKKELKLLRYFKSLIIFCLLMIAYVAYDLIDEYGLSEMTACDYMDCQKYDRNGNRINRGWE